MTKRICFFVGHYSPSVQVIMEYYEKIFPKDIELFFVCANKVDRNVCDFKRTKLFEFFDKKYIFPFKLRKFLKEKNIDLLVTLSGQAEVSGTLVISTAFTKTKGAFYFLGNPRIELKNYLFLLTQFFTARFFSCCKEVGDKFRKFLFLSRNKIIYLPFPINTCLFKPKNKSDLKKKLGFKKNDKVLIYVGRVEFEQGSDYLLELIEKNPNKKFLLIGEIRDENFKGKKFKNVVHIPHIPNKKLSDYYNVTDMTLFFSKRNSYPYPPRESLACGIPVIVFDLNTFGQLKTKPAIKVPFDIDKIQQEIDNFFSLSKKEKKKLSEEGIKFVFEDSSEEKIKEETLDCFFDLLKYKRN